MVRLKPWLLECPDCHLLRASFAPGRGRGIKGLEPLRRQNFDRLLDRLDGMMAGRGRTLLEIGCGEGWFLEAASLHGFAVHGIDPHPPDDRASHMAHAIECGFFPADLSDRGPYDVIVFNDVFEHLDDPAASIRSVESLLAPGGIAVINLPVSSGAIYRTARFLDRVGIHGPYDRLWQRGLPSPHLSYFNADNLRALVTARTTLTPAAEFPLPSLMRAGLWQRIRSTHGGAGGPFLYAAALYAAAWGLSHWAATLRPDILVLVFEKTADSP